MKGLSNVSLADHLQQEGVMRCSPTESSPPPSGTAHLLVISLWLHVQLDGQGGYHPPGADVHQHLLQREENLFTVSILAILQHERLHSLPDHLLDQLRHDGVELDYLVPPPRQPPPYLSHS